MLTYIFTNEILLYLILESLKSQYVRDQFDISTQFYQSTPMVFVVPLPLVTNSSEDTVLTLIISAHEFSFCFSGMWFGLSSSVIRMYKEDHWEIMEEFLSTLRDHDVRYMGEFKFCSTHILKKWLGLYICMHVGIQHQLFAVLWFTLSLLPFISSALSCHPVSRNYRSWCGRLTSWWGTSGVNGRQRFKPWSCVCRTRRMNSSQPELCSTRGAQRYCVNSCSPWHVHTLIWSMIVLKVIRQLSIGWSETKHVPYCIPENMFNS